MKVRFVRRHELAGRSGGAFLTIGCDYVVLSMIAREDRVDLLVLDDVGKQPGWHNARDFDLVSDEVPSTWRVRVGGAGIVGRIEIAPEPWLEDTFWNDFWGDAGATTVAARDSFDRELEIIMRESG